MAAQATKNDGICESLERHACLCVAETTEISKGVESVESASDLVTRAFNTTL